MIRKPVIVRCPENFNIFNYGDTHIGCSLYYRKGWHRFANMFESEYEGVSSEFNFAVDHADMIEAISITDKRFDLQVLESTRMAQVLYQAKVAAGLRRFMTRGNRLKVILKGNHEHKVLPWLNVSEHVCRNLKVPYGTVSAVLHYINRRNGQLIFKQYAHHGFGGIKSVAEPELRKKANEKLILMRKFARKFGDTLLNTMGHTHKLMHYDPYRDGAVLYLTTEDKGIQQHYTGPRKVHGYIEPNHRWYVNTGSFRRIYGEGFDDYAERAGYDPVQLGFAIVKVRDLKIVEIDEIRI